MTHPSVTGSGHRQSRLAGSASLVLHGGLVLVFVLAGKRVVDAPPQAPAVTSIEVVKPSPPTKPPPPPMPIARPIPSATAEARARPAQGKRSQRFAAAKQSLADLAVSYDHPTNFASNAANTVDGIGDAGSSGIRTGIDRQLGDDVANLPIPQPTFASRARSPRPKFDYSKLRIPGASKFAGRIMKVVLRVDTAGHVRGAQVLEGVDRDLDRRILALVSHFEFEPALDDVGAVIPGTSRWNLEIVSDEEDEPFPTTLGRPHF
jgi:hypothetical protein